MDSKAKVIGSVYYEMVTIREIQLFGDRVLSYIIFNVQNNLYNKHIYFAQKCLSNLKLNVNRN